MPVKVEDILSGESESDEEGPPGPEDRHSSSDQDSLRQTPSPSLSPAHTFSHGPDD